MTDREAKIEKVRRLLRLANGTGATEAEAATAAAAAERIMLEHDIAEAELDARDDADRGAPPPVEVTHDVLWTGNGQVLEEEWLLTHAVTTDAGRGVRPFVTKTRTAAGKTVWCMRAIGTPDDIEVARLTYAYLRDQIVRLTRDAYEERGRPGLKWRYSFSLGCTIRVRERIIADRRVYTADVRRLASPGALAIVDDRARLTRDLVAAAAKRLHLTSQAGSSRAGGDDGAYAAGRRAGDRVDTSAPARGGRIGGGSS